MDDNKNGIKGSIFSIRPEENDNFDSSLVNIDNLIKSTELSPRGWADVIKTALQKI